MLVDGVGDCFMVAFKKYIRIFGTISGRESVGKISDIIITIEIAIVPQKHMFFLG